MSVKSLFSSLKYYNPLSKSNLDKQFYTFYILQLLVFSCGLARATAVGFVLYKIGVSPQQLGLMTAIATCGMLVGFWVTPHLQRMFKSADAVFEFSQKAVCLISVVLMFYILYCFYHNNWGNFWFWTFMSTIGSFFISTDQSSRPLLVKSKFPNVNFSKIMRQDILTMGIAKVFGFATGAIIVSKLWVFFIFLIGFLISFAMIKYIKKLKTPVIPVEINIVITHFKKKEISYVSTVTMHMVTSLLLFPINTQVITYSKIWGFPFYWFYIMGSLGNVFFNVVINPRVGMTIGRAYIFYIGCLLTGFSLFLLPSSLVLLGAFLVGGAYSSFNTLASSRLYEGTSTKPNPSKFISRYYVCGSIGCMIGSYFLGESLGNLEKNTVFASLIIISIIFYGALFIVSNKSMAYVKK